MNDAQAAVAERQLDLLAFLLAQRRPVPVARIYDELAHLYVGSEDARDRKFSRDKEDLRELGLELTHVLAGDEDEGGGYVIDRSRFFLPDIDLTPDERAALFAVGSAAQAGAFPLKSELALGLLKLRAATDEDEETTAPNVHATSRGEIPFADLLARATARRWRVAIRYAGGGERRVDPYAYVVRRGRASVVGFCHLRGAVRTFHVDRLGACRLVNAKADAPEFELPAGFDQKAHLITYPWQVNVHEPREVTVAFDEAHAESGPRALGIDSSGVVRTTNVDGLIAQVLALGTGARIAAPESARARVRELLGGVS